MQRDKSEKKDHHKKKYPPKLWSEKSPSEIKEHEELVHEDKDPIYPLDESIEDMKKGLGPKT